MKVLVFVVLILAMTGHSSGSWCICKDGLSDAALQKTLDYACGAGADCTLIHQNGACFNPNTVRAHCSFAVNSYFQKKGQAPGTCDFAGSAIPSASDPSTAGCAYPSSLSSAGTSATPITTTPSTTPSTTTPSTTTPSTTTPSTTTPYTATPSNGVLGGIGAGLGPSGGAGINTDISHGGFILQDSSLFSFFITLMFSGLVFWWG